MQGSTLDASREDVAVITIGQSTTDLGIIQTANAPALRMFGYNRRDLLGLNIDVLVPQPLATVHQYFMLKYIESGREVTKCCPAGFVVIADGTASDRFESLL